MTFRLILILLAFCVFAHTANRHVAVADSVEQTPWKIASIGGFSYGDGFGADEESYTPQSQSDTSVPEVSPKRLYCFTPVPVSSIHSNYNIRAPPR